MKYIPFYEYFPEVAEKETRTLIIPPNARASIPPGNYTYLELFCGTKDCDCRRVFFYVVTQDQEDPVAVIAYGWMNTQFYRQWMGDDDPAIIRTLKGPVLNLTSPQSDIATPILEMTKAILLKDRAYIDRVKRHYRMFKRFIDSQPDTED